MGGRCFCNATAVCQSCRSWQAGKQAAWAEAESRLTIGPRIGAARPWLLADTTAHRRTHHRLFTCRAGRVEGPVQDLFRTARTPFLVSHKGEGGPPDSPRRAAHRTGRGVTGTGNVSWLLCRGMEGEDEGREREARAGCRDADSRRDSEEVGDANQTQVRGSRTARNGIGPDGLGGRACGKRMGSAWERQGLIVTRSARPGHWQRPRRVIPRSKRQRPLPLAAADGLAGPAFRW